MGRLVSFAGGCPVCGAQPGYQEAQEFPKVRGCLAIAPVRCRKCEMTYTRYYERMDRKFISHREMKRLQKRALAYMRELDGGGTA